MLCAGAAVLALRFVLAHVLRYVHWDAVHYGRYWPIRGALAVHVAGAVLALSCGPLQLWSGWRGRTARAHRVIGRVYVLALTASGATGLWIALTSPVFPTFGVAVAVLAAAWLSTTGLAYAAIRRGHVAMHRELMIRSYVLTFSAVLGRWWVELPLLTELTMAERFTTFGWLSWAAPLVVTELILQARKIASPAPA